MEALAALKAMRSKPLERSVQTKTASFKQFLPLVAVTKLESVTQPQTVTRGGRGKKVHASRAQKQKAYRDRKKAKA